MLVFVCSYLGNACPQGGALWLEGGKTLSLVLPLEPGSKFLIREKQCRVEKSGAGDTTITKQTRFLLRVLREKISKGGEC